MREVKEFVTLKLTDLTPYEKNARKHGQEDVAAIRKSIEQFGFSDPIGVWGDKNIIVEGHGRYEAAKALGLEEIPCIRLDHLNDEERRAYALAHNRTAELSEWDFDTLKDELADIDMDLSMFGFDKIEEKKTAESLDEVEEDNYDPATEPEPMAKLGDIYQLGDHRLMCGDSASREDMEALMDGEAPVFVFTDPPYGVAIGDKNERLNKVSKGGKCHANIKNDNIAIDDLSEILKNAFVNLREACSNHCSYYVSSPQSGDLMMMMMMMMKDAGLPLRHTLIWVKNTHSFSLSLDYSYKHEPIFYTWTKSHKFYGDFSSSVIDDTKPVDKMDKNELKALIRALQEKKETDVIYEDKPLVSDLHPTMKPIKLIARLMINSSRKDDVIADIFGGSGSTIIAAEQLGRKCRMMELDPHYVDVIIDRWEKYTGGKAEKIKDGKDRTPAG